MISNYKGIIMQYSWAYSQNWYWANPIYRSGLSEESGGYGLPPQPEGRSEGLPPEIF